MATRNFFCRQKKSALNNQISPCIYLIFIYEFTLDRAIFLKILFEEEIFHAEEHLECLEKGTELNSRRRRTPDSKFWNGRFLN